MKNTMMIVTLFVLFVLNMALNVGCASNPHKAEKLDTEVKLAATVSTDQVIGVKSGNMVVQKKVLMSEELRKLQNEVYELEARVYGGPRYYDNYGLYGSLKNCYFKQAQATNQKLIKMPEAREYVVPDSEETKIGLDEKDKIVGVNEEFLKDRIERFMTYKKILTGREAEYEDRISMCELATKQPAAQDVADKGE